MALSLKSSVFDDGSEIPRKYSCQGEDVSPPLSWSGVPQETRSLALVCSDPDAPGGTFQHWAVFDLPPGTEGLDEGFTVGQIEGAREAVNDFGNAGYGGPCPPEGHGPHRYRFKLYALGQGQLSLGEAAKVEQVIEAAEAAAIETAELVGTYER